MGLGVAEGAEAAGDFLLDLGHSDVALGAVVGERDVGFAGEAERLGFVFDQRLVEVLLRWRSVGFALGVGSGDAPALPVEPDGGRGEFPFGLGQDRSVTLAHGLEGVVVERLAVVFADLAAGFEQELAHAPGPGVAVGVLDEGEVAQQVGAVMLNST